MTNLTRLLFERSQLSMRDALKRIALMHCEINAPGFDLALGGHYRQAFNYLRRHPRSLQNRFAAVQRFYVLALYAEHLEPQAKGYFAQAEAELQLAIKQLEERYGWEWVSFADKRYEMELLGELEKAVQNRYQFSRPVFAF